MSKNQNQPMNVNFGKAKGVVLGLIVLIIIGVTVSYTHLTLPTILLV